MTTTPEESARETVQTERRAVLKKVGRFAAATAPTVTLLLTATAKPKNAVAVSVKSSRQFKNPEGAVDTDALLFAALVGNPAAFDVIDGIGTCFAAIKALHARIDRLEATL